MFEVVLSCEHSQKYIHNLNTYRDAYHSLLTLLSTGPNIILCFLLQGRSRYALHSYMTEENRLIDNSVEITNCDTMSVTTMSHTISLYTLTMSML